MSRVQDRQLKAKREIRIAALFKGRPADFLRIDRRTSFGAPSASAGHDRQALLRAVGCHMEPADYRRTELDLLRLWLTARELPDLLPAGAGSLRSFRVENGPRSARADPANGPRSRRKAQP